MNKYFINESECIQYYISQNKSDLFIRTIGYHNFNSVTPCTFNRMQTVCTLHYVISGGGYLTVNDKKYKIKQNDIFFIDDKSVFCYYPDPNAPWEYVWLEFSGDKAKSYAANVGLSQKNPVLECMFFQKEHYLLLHFFESVLQKKYTHYFDVLTIFFSLLSSVRTETTSLNAFNEKNYIDEIKSYIEIKYTDCNFTIENLCSLTHLSHSHMCRIFKNHENETVKSYLIRKRLLKAEELLKTTKLSVKEIAYTCGFKEANYFMLLFKKHRSLTPLEFRNKK